MSYGDDTTSDSGAANGGGLTWYNGIQQIFTPYVSCMQQQGIDLSSYTNTDGTGVSDNITVIQQYIDDDSMPMNSGGIDYKAMWAKANGKALFDQWYAAGYPEGTPTAAKGATSAEATTASSGSITWTNTMQAVFAPYVQCMLQATGGAIDLSQYSTSGQTGVADNIQAIQQQIDSGGMPINQGGVDYKAMWAKANGKQLFDQWFAAGYPK
jgi:hypothetical protein